MGFQPHVFRHERVGPRRLSARAWVVAWVAVAGLAAGGFPARADSPATGATTARPVVRVGVLAYRGVERTRAEWEPTMGYLAAALPGYDFRLEPLDHARINQSVAAGEVDFVITTSANYVELEADGNANHIATLRVLQNGLPCTKVGGVIFTRADRTDIRTLDDLRGKKFVAYDRHAFGGWWMAWRELLAADIVPNQDFASLRFTGGAQDDVVRAVLAGKDDAGTVRTDLLERMAAEGQIRMSDVRVIHRQPEAADFPFVHSTRLYAEWPAAALRATDPELTRQVAVALMQMPADSPAAKAASCAGWTVPQDYNPVHDLMRELRLGPYAQYGLVTPGQAARQYWFWLVAAGALLLLLAAVVVRQYRRGRTLDRLEARAVGPAAGAGGRAISWLPRAAGLGVIAVAALALAGWGLNVAVLKSVVPGIKAMNPTSSCLYILAGGALLLQTSGAGRVARAAAFAAAGVVAAAGLLRLGGYLGLDLGVDQVVFTDLLGTNRMAPTTAACFLLAGSALVLIDLTTRAGHRPADWLALAGAALPLVALLGYIFQARFFYTIGAANPMALNSAAAMLLLCLGILVARPDRGLMAMITGGSAGGVVLRTLLPAAVGVPVALGVLRMMGQRLGLFDAQVGLSLFTLSTIVVLIVLVWWNAGLLHRLDLRRRAAEEQLRRAHDELEHRVEERTVQLTDANRSLTREIGERRKAQTSLTHLNAVLRSIQHINQLVIREQDPQALAWRACQTLTATRGYEAAWIALGEGPAALTPVAHAGLGEQFPCFLERSARGEKPPCLAAALAAAGVVPIADQPTFCQGCPLDRQHTGRQALVVRLEHAGLVSGVLAVYAAADAPIDQQELGLIEELAGDVGLALHKMTVEAQKANLEQRYLQAQKMEAIGRLAGGIAHDFRNQLTVIGGYAELALMDLPADSPLRAHLGEIRKAAQRSTNLTGQLLAFSRRQMLAPQVLNLNDVLAEMAHPLATMVGEDIEVTLTPQPALGNVRVDRGQFEQAVMNVVANARDAMPHGGQLTLATSEVDSAAANPPPDTAGGPYVRLAISDTGVGMDQAVLTRIFEPYFTTKEKGKGTGLGLSMVYGFVSQSGGWIHVDSRPGEGTTLAIYIPRVVEPVEPDAPHPDQAPAPVGHETILVAEDERPVRAFVVSSLRHYGYNVLEAAGGQEALDLAAQHGDRIHLLLTDIVMPHLSGAELAERLAATRPATKVLFMSGYASDSACTAALLAPGLHHIPKPFSPEALAQKVRQLLDS